MRSRTTRSKGTVRNRSSPSRPSPAAATLKPAASNPREVVSRIDGSSSTRRIRSFTASILHGAAASLALVASREEILSALEGVYDPELGRSVVELDMVREVTVDGGRVGVVIALTVPGCPLRASFQEQVETALRPLDGVEEVELGFDVMTPEEKAALTTRLRGGVTERTPGISVDSRTRVL